MSPDPDITSGSSLPGSDQITSPLFTDSDERVSSGAGHSLTNSEPEGGFNPSFPSGSRFQDIHFLGRGGMGQVFSAFDPLPGRRVALKLLRSDDEEARLRLSLEARALAQVDHPNVIKLFEVGSIEGLPYLVMPLLEGDTLLTACEECSLEEKIRILREVAEGIHAAHLRGLLHRDIKPIPCVSHDFTTSQRGV